MATTQQTIQGYYQNILLRTGSAADVTFWSNMVDVQGVPLSQIENTFVTCPEATTFVLPIVEIYQTYLGRAPDQAGFAAWVHAFEGGMQLSAIENAFATSAESAAYYGGSASTPADAAFVTKLYQTVLNRAPTPTEVTSVLAVTTNRATLQLDFLSSPEANVTLRNAANQFLTTVGTGNATPYGASLYGAGGTFANTFTLTPGADIIPGGLVGSNGTNSNSGNDLINGVVDSNTPANTTLNAADNLNGGAGSNTISVTYAGPAFVPDATNGALISGVQTFNARNTDPAAFVTLDANNVPGLTAFNSNLGTGDVEVDNLAAGASAGIIGNGTVENGELDVSYVAAATAATINFSGGTGNAGPPAVGPFVDVFGGAGVTSTTVNSTGGANTIDELDLFGTATKTLTVVADSNLKALTGVFSPALTGITVSGSATSVSLGSLAGDPVKTIDASGLTAGGVSVKGVGSTLTTFTGGVGNDSLVFAAGGITGSQTLNGGTGTNTLGTADAGGADLPAPTYTGINASTNFQTLQLTGAGVVNLNQAAVTNAAFTKVQFSNAAIDPTVTNAVTAVDYSITAAAAVELNAAVGQTVLNASLDGTSTAIATAGSIEDVAAQTFNLASNGSFTTANTVTFPDSFFLPDNTLFNITGSQPLTTGAVIDTGPGVIGETVNAGTFTGKLTLNNTTGTSGTNFTTGANGSAITASTGAGIINSFTLGTGADKLSFLAGSSQIGAGTGTTDTATNFDATKDSFALGHVPTAVDPFSGGGTNVLLTDLNAAIDAVDPLGLTANHVGLVTITSGTDAGTYLASTAGGVAGHLVGADTAVHLAGLTGTLGASNFV